MTNIVKRNFFAYLFLGTLVIFVLLFSAILLWSRYNSRTISLQDLYKTHCDTLPSITQIDALYANNKSSFSLLLNDLSTCENNIAVCKRSGMCKEEEYSKRRVRSGNTVFEWKYVLGCEKQNKGALYIAYTSGCEIQKIDEYFKKHPEFLLIPIKYENY